MNERRRFLAALGALTASAGLAGCGGGGEQETEQTPTETESEPTATPTPERESITSGGVTQEWPPAVPREEPDGGLIGETSAGTEQYTWLTTVYLEQLWTIERQKLEEQKKLRQAVEEIRDLARRTF